MLDQVRLFTEAVLRSTAIVLDLAMRGIATLFSGFRAAATAASADHTVASIIASFIVTGLGFGVLWILVLAVRNLQLDRPGRGAIWIGRLFFWAGCAIGLYFLGVTFFLLAHENVSPDLYRSAIATAVFYPVLGRTIRYIMGR